MKKLKIRGNELKKIGFTNDRAIALCPQSCKQILQKVG
jgi:hypothetical protein